MDKIYMNAEDKNIAASVVYVNSEKALFYDEAFTQPVDPADMFNLFTKGVLVSYGGSFVKPVSCTYDGALKFDDVFGVTCDVNIDPDFDFWGKKVGDLQEGIEFGANKIVGTLKYVEDYSSAFPEGMNKGNYLALHFETNVPNATIKIIGTTTATLDADGLIVQYIAERQEGQEEAAGITAEVYANNELVVSRHFDISGLKLEAGPVVEEESVEEATD